MKVRSHIFALWITKSNVYIRFPIKVDLARTVVLCSRFLTVREGAEVKLSAQISGTIKLHFFRSEMKNSLDKHILFILDKTLNKVNRQNLETLL